jgi:hypothetical protein
MLKNSGGAEWLFSELGNIYAAIKDMQVSLIYSPIVGRVSEPITSP